MRKYHDEEESGGPSESKDEDSKSEDFKGDSEEPLLHLEVRY